MQKCTAAVINEVGLHARPAALFVQSAGLYQSKIMVRNVTSDREFVDAKSILGVLILCVKKDHLIEITAEGADEQEALATLRRLVESDFRDLPAQLASGIESRTSKK
jgi:phosphotransferase system HPr (HPr) family protein